MSETPRMRELVAGYRRAIAPHADDRVRIWARLQEDDTETEPATTPVRRIAAVIAIALAVAATVVLVLGLAGRLVDRTAVGARSQSADVPAAPELGVAHSSEVPREAAAALPPAAPPVALPLPTTESSLPTQPSVQRREAPTFDPLRAELAIIEAASAAIDRGDHALALRRLDEHAKRHPAGKLRPEARALRAIALCASGRTAQGRGEAQQLLRDASLSTHHRRVREACGLQ